MTNVTEYVDRMPMSLVFAGTMVLVLVSIGVGHAIGAWRRKRLAGEGGEAVGSAVGAMLGLLAFVLAFTFGMTAARFDARKQLLLDEVNGIGTAAHRADLLPEPHRSECRRLIKRYVDIRAQRDVQAADLPGLIAEAETIQNQLWAQATALARADMNSDIGALFVESVNELIELQTSRIAVGLYYRIPLPIWLWLIAATSCSMLAVGYQFGLAGRKKILVHLMLAAIFSSVVVLIADLDRAAEGTLKVNRQPMFDLQERLNEAGY